MGAVYKSICNEADTFLLIITRLAEKEIQLKVDLEKLMNEGFVNIAKARYIMGSTCVTKMQLPTENSNPIQPLVTVYRKKINDSWIFCIERRNCLKNTGVTSEIFKDNIENSDDYASTGSSVKSIYSIGKSKIDFKNILQTDPKSIRKSKNAFLVKDDLYQSYNDELLDEISNSDSNESLVSVTDPMRLFGILVPKAMKQAQLIFNDVINLLGECATIQYELKEALHKFYHLEKVKRLIEATCKEMKVNILIPKVYWTPTESSYVSCYSVKTEEQDEEELSDISQVSVMKSVRSVFYDMDNTEQHETEFSVWNSVNSESESIN